MSFAMKHLIIIFTYFSLLILNASAATRFTSNYPCQENGRTCVSSGVRTVDGFQVHKDCWEYSYSKTCNYPSKNNCSEYSHCYGVAILECLLRDSYGHCVNQKKEFSCKRWVPDILETKKVRVGLEDKKGTEGLVCRGIPCIDGNCVDKSYETNGEMMDSISKLYMTSQMKDGGDPNFKLFEGFGSHCSKKASSYTNCCGVGKGWGKNLGAGCTKDEQDLIDKRQKNLCVYVGKVNKQKMGVTTVVKHHFCCFGNMLNKVIQVEGRKQLMPNVPVKEQFGTGGNPDCRGLTLAELERLDFDKMDFGEFIDEFKVKFFGKYKKPNIGDMTARIQDSIPNIKKYDESQNNRENNKSGWSGKLDDDSFEADEERIAEEERKRELARQEALMLTEKREVDNKNQRRIAKEQELQQARREDKRLRQENLDWQEEMHKKYGTSWMTWNMNTIKSIDYARGARLEAIYKAQDEIGKLENKIMQDLQTGNY